MGNRKDGLPAPWIDQWGKPTWDNPYGQLKPNPEYLGKGRAARKRAKSAHAAAEAIQVASEQVAAEVEVAEQPTAERDAPVQRAPWRHQPAGGTTG